MESKQNEKPSEAKDIEDKNKESNTGNDDELENLLDSALDDFGKPPLPQTDASSQPLSAPSAEGSNGASGGSESTKASVGELGPETEAAFNDIFADASQSKQFEDMMRSLMGDNKELYQNIEKLATAASHTDDTVEGQKQFEKTLQDTVSSMAENTQQLQNDLPEEELLKMLGGMGLGGQEFGAFGGAEGGADGGAMGDFMPMMQTMMKSILSKDVLYPSIKDVSSKYPKYLEENKDKLSAADYQTYTKQYELMNRICKEFEQETDSDSETVKDKRMETIMDLMENMRELGQPPTELVGEMPPGFDANMFGSMPSTPEQCAIM